MNLSKRFTNNSNNSMPYDKIIVGAGPVGLACAYEILRTAHQMGTPIKLAVIAEKVSSPSQAGSQPFYGTDGHFDGRKVTPEEDVLWRDGRRAFYDTIDREKIACREQKGLEVKTSTREELDSFINILRDCNIVNNSDPISINSSEQILKMGEFEHSLLFKGAGQVNLPELQQGLIQKIQELGGQVIEGIRYEGQTQDTNVIKIHTNKGDFETTDKPLLVTDAKHLLSFPELKNSGEAMYTMSVVIGPLDKEDRARIATKPVAYAFGDLKQNLYWGSLDEKGFLTIGTGDSTDPNSYDDTKKTILSDLEKLCPGLGEKYASQMQVSFGVMYVPENGLPVVGRLKEFDVASGWGGRGIVPGYAAALAYADHFVKNDDTKLRVFERMQKDLPFLSNQATATPSKALNPT